MDRKSRRREERRVARDRRRAELKLRRAQDALKPQVKVEIDADLRGLSAQEWDRRQALDFRAVFDRAREMFPHYPPLRNFGRKGFARLISDSDARAMARRLTLAARTLSFDPPWFIPLVRWVRKGPVVSFDEAEERCDTRQDPDLGRIGHWGLVLPYPGVADVEVWFTSHAIERLTYRLMLDHPVRIRAAADGWVPLLQPDPPVQQPLYLRRIEERVGEPVLTLRAFDGMKHRDLGFFPVVRQGPRVLAKTFLEPWMVAGASPGSPLTEERRRQREEFVDQTIAWARELFFLLAQPEEEADILAIYGDWLKRSYGGLPAPSIQWMSTLSQGKRLAKAMRYAEAKAALEEGFVMMQEELARLPATLRAEHDRDAKLQRGVAGAHFLLAMVYSRASAYGTGKARAPGSVPPEQARDWLTRAFEEFARALDVAPDMVRFWQRDEDFDPMRADPRWSPFAERFAAGGPPAEGRDGPTI